MIILKYPEISYGPLPSKERADKELADFPHRQTPEGAMDYLDIHIGRVEYYLPLLIAKGYNFWTILQRFKAKREFINTTLALRIIATWHQDNQELLEKMASQVDAKYQADPEGPLARHYHYVAYMLRKIGNTV